MLNLVLNAFAEVVDVVAKRDAARIERLNNAWSEANENVPPIVDRQGRLHAPVDGYSLPHVHEDYALRNYDDVVFAKGQYLPVPLSRDEDIAFLQQRKSATMAEKYQAREKIKVDAELADAIIAELGDNMFISISKGKSWEVNGTQVCYMYLTGNKSFLTQFYEAIKGAIENKDKQVYTGEGVDGRVRVKGQVISVKDYDDYDFRYNPTTVRRCIIKLDNDSTCFGNVPSNVYFDLEGGDEVEFTASFTKSEKDNHHSYFKRPFKMVILKKSESE